MRVSGPWNTQKWEYISCFFKKRQQHKEWASQITGVLSHSVLRRKNNSSVGQVIPQLFGLVSHAFFGSSWGWPHPCPRFLGWWWEEHWPVFLFPSSQHPRLGGTLGDLSILQFHAMLNLTGTAQGFFLLGVENLWERRSTASSSA